MKHHGMTHHSIGNDVPTKDEIRISKIRMFQRS